MNKMSLHYIDEPHRSKVVDILSQNLPDEDKLQRLKLYLISEPYFKHFSDEPSWLTREIFKDFKRNGR